MRLLHVTHQYRPAIGGAELYMANLSEELARRGHDVTVFTSRACDYQTWRTELIAAEELAGVHVRRFRSLVRGRRAWRMLTYAYQHHWHTGSRRYEPLIFLGNGPVCPALFWSLLLRAPSYDLVHISNLHYAHAATAYLAARVRGTPVVITPHIHTEQPVTYRVQYMQDMLRGCDHILTDTQAEREFIIEAGLDHQRITTAGVGLHLDAFPKLDQRASRQELGLPNDGFVLLFLGRKTEYKGLDITVEAFASLRRQYSDLYLVTAGPETVHSQQLWQQFAGLSGVTNLARVPDKMRLAALNACDCLVLPSIGEAFGIVFLEAWAVGKPVIGAYTPAVASLITDGRDGFLIAPGSAFELATRIACLLQEPTLCQRMGEQGRKKVINRYTVGRVTDIVEGVHSRVLRRRRTGRAQY
jgi:glycosyltransferase involved in cell wall biosynthesis